MKMDAPRDEPEHKYRKSLTILPSQGGNEVPGHFPARGEIPGCCALSSLAAATVELPAQKPARSELSHPH